MIDSIQRALNFKPKHLAPPFSWVGHIPFASALIGELKPTVLVELGTHTGNSYFSFCQAVQENSLPTRCYAVDTWSGEEHAGVYNESVFETVSGYNFRNYSNFSKLLRTTFDEAVKDFEDQHIDLLHIDGLHTYDAVKKDYETWQPKVRDGGVILFHDICARHGDFGVWKLWEEIQQNNKYTFSFLHSHGLGVLFKGDSLVQNEFLSELMNKRHSIKWQERFATVGDDLVNTAEAKQEKITAQLYLGNNSEFTDRRSYRREYNTGDQVCLKFDSLEQLIEDGQSVQLRFDPADCAGLLAIKEITFLFQKSDGLKISKKIDLKTELSPAGDLIACDKDFYTHISIGPDPQFIIDPITMNEGRLTGIEVTLLMNKDPIKIAAALTKIVKERGEDIATLQQDFRNKDEAVANLQHDIGNKDQAVATLQEDIRNKDEAVANLQEDIRNKDQVVANLQQDIRNKDQVVANLQQDIRDKDEAVATLQHDIRDKDEAVATLQHDIRHRDEAVATLQHDIRDKDEAVAVRQDKINRMQCSFSWRCTAPFRALRRWLGKTRLRPRFNFYIDSFPSKGLVGCFSGPIQIAGWCFDSSGQPADCVYIQIGQRKIKCNSVLRGDLSAIYALDNYRAGFSSLFTTGDGFKLIKVFAETSGVKIKLKQCLIFVTKPKNDFGKNATPDMSSRNGAAPVQPLQNTSERLNEIIAAERLENLKSQPLISIITPVYNVDPKWLRLTINSVENQWYKNWELILIDDKSDHPPLVEFLKEIKNPKLRIIHLDKNLNISGATNKGLEVAQGDFVAFLDHDDELTPDALLEIAVRINEKPDLDVIYSDQDKISEEGVTSEPFHKPDWSPTLLIGVMYVGHLLIVRRSLANAVGGFKSAFNNVQDYEFMLRISEQTDKIEHISKILYHWRSIPGSLARGLDEKDSITELQARAVNAHLQRTGSPAQASPHPIHPHRVICTPLPRESQSQPKVSIIIPTKDAPVHIERCLSTIFGETSYDNFEVIVVDNGTTDEAALRTLTKFPVKIINYDENFNYSRANNLGVEHSTGKYLIFLNNDTEIITPDWIEKMLYFAEKDYVGAVGPMLLYPDSTIQHAGVVLGFRGTADHVMRGFRKEWDGYFGSLSCPREVSAVTAACLMMKKTTFANINGFDEFFKTHYQDVDLCLKIRELGLSIIFTPNTELIHHESISRKDSYDFVDREILIDRWGDAITAGDPYYNPNFSLDTHDYTVKVST